ncbi:hypothetical protein SAMN04487787_101629 [Kosakonia sacchari]|nr:hypothetical protein SAMN04487787_101629 [Kosakonia sacchari]
MASNVSYSKNFLKLASHLSDEELFKIRHFVNAALGASSTQLPGRNKPSTHVSPRHFNRNKLIQYAIDNDLWHYHVGYTKYDTNKPYGDWTSSHILHYQNQQPDLKLVHYDSHPPFRLPLKAFLI